MGVAVEEGTMGAAAGLVAVELVSPCADDRKACGGFHFDHVVLADHPWVIGSVSHHEAPKERTRALLKAGVVIQFGNLRALSYVAG
jgi:hypothetical protein